MQEFIDFANANEIEMTATRIPSRTGDAWESRADTPDPIHFHILLTVKAGGKLRTLWSGDYSQGIGIVERWALKAKPSAMMTARVGRESMRTLIEWNKKYRHDSEYWEHMRVAYAKAVTTQGAKPVLSVAEILQCLQMDIMNADQNFEDWAGDLGYSEDSIKARGIWDDCNKIRRTMRDALGAEFFAAFEELQED
jgi:hypothetical protein